MKEAEEEVGEVLALVKDVSSTDLMALFKKCYEWSKPRLANP